MSCLRSLCDPRLGPPDAKTQPFGYPGAMQAERRYDDPCGVARALDVVGDRWALLVVRELMFGPRRFTQLRVGLHGISPNVLAQRLRDLQGAGVVKQDTLDPPASVAVYELTGRGRALAPVLVELGRWGSSEPMTTTSELSASALMLALQTVFDPAAAIDGRYAIGVDGEWFGVSVAGRSISIASGRLDRPDAILQADVATLRSFAFGRESITAAEGDGRLAVTGDRGAAERFGRMFTVAPPRPAG
jgi:DNA-binding HxlR family transcriptional regulator